MNIEKTFSYNILSSKLKNLEKVLDKFQKILYNELLLKIVR